MSTPGRMDTIEQARDAVVRSMPHHFDRLSWSEDRLRDLRVERLRALLTVALEKSPFHARRLSGVDPSTFDLDDLATLPVMTKREMMSRYDDVVTDRRVTLASAQQHLNGVTDQARLYVDEFVVLVSGGSSGLRGVFTYRWDAAVEFVSAVLRAGLARMAAQTGWPPSRPVSLAVVAAPICVHPTRLLPTFVEGVVGAVTYAPVTLPFDAIVRRVNDAQPVILAGYASSIARLADAQAAGLLAIEPKVVLTTSEQLTPELSARIEAGLGTPPANSFGSSEGLIGSAPPRDDVFSFASDLSIIEYVDAEDRHVPIGVPSHHVLVTNLFNQTQPLIRYRIDDTMTSAVPANDHGHQRAKVDGRLDETLTLQGRRIHPVTIRSALLQHPQIVEYQVRSSASTLDVDIVAQARIDPHVVRDHVRAALVGAGAAPVEVNVRSVESIRQDPFTGKTRRFLTV